MAGSHEVRGSIPLGSTTDHAPFERAALFVCAPSGAARTGTPAEPHGHLPRLLYEIRRRSRNNKDTARWQPPEPPKGRPPTRPFSFKTKTLLGVYEALLCTQRKSLQ